MPSSFDLRGSGQVSVPIAQLHPSNSPDTSTFVGQVALIWPYSSSKISFGLLIVEPDFRLRREQGQVHVDFSGSSAKVLARSGVKIGDEILLSLVGVEWARDKATPRTPGDGIDWALCFRERLILQLSRNSQEITLLDIDHPTSSPEPPIRSPIRSPANGLARTRSRMDSESDTRAWSSPAFLKRNQLPYATYLNTQYDPFRDESISEGGERRKKMRLGKQSYQWTFANRTPSPEKEGRLEVYESCRYNSLDLIEGADDGLSSTSTLQLGPVEQKGVLIHGNSHDKNLPSHGTDEAIVDELASENIAEHDPQGHISLNKDARQGVTLHTPPDPESESSIIPVLGRQDLRPEPSEVNIQAKLMSQISAEDRQSTPTRRELSIRQESPPSDTIRNSPNRDPVNEPPLTESLDTQDLCPEPSEFNVEDRNISQILAEDRQSTPTHRELSIRQESPPSDTTSISPNRDPVNESLITDGLDTQDLRPEPSEVNVEDKNVSQFLADDRQLTPSRRESSKRQESPPSDTPKNSPDRDPVNGSLITEGLDIQDLRSEPSEVNIEDKNISQILVEDRQLTPTRRESSIRQESPSDTTLDLPSKDPVDESPTTEGLVGQELRSESSSVNVQDEDASQILAEGRQSTPIMQDFSIRRESSPCDTTHNSPSEDPANERPMTEDLDRQEFLSESREVNRQNEDASQVLAGDYQSLPVHKDASVKQGSPKHATRKSPDRDPDDEPSTVGGLDQQELRPDTSDNDMEDVESSQIVPTGRKPSSVSRDSSISRNSLSNGTRDKLPKQFIDDNSHPIKSSDGQELHTATKMDIEELAPQVLPEDRPDSLAIEISPAHRDSPRVDATIKTSQRLKLSQPKEVVSLSESPEYLASTDSMSLAPQFLPEDRPDSSVVELSSPHRDSPVGDLTIGTSQRLKLSQPKREGSPSDSPASPTSTDFMSQDSVAESPALLEDVSEDDSSSTRESINYSREAISTVSPLQSHFADLEGQYDDESSTGLESEDELMYPDSNGNTRENSPTSHISSSSLEASRSSDVTPEGIPSDTPGFGADGFSVSLARSSVDNPPRSSHKAEEIPKGLETPFAWIETVADAMETPKYSSKPGSLAADGEANSDPLENINADDKVPDDEIAKASEENERQGMRPMTLFKPHANEIPQESDSIDGEDMSQRDQDMDRVSAGVSAARSGEDDETDDETKIAVLPKPTSDASPNGNREFEKDVSTREDEFKISPDDDHSAARQDNESQFVQTKPTIDIIDLESEGEDDIMSTSPHVKQEPSQALVNLGNTDDVIFEDSHIAKQEHEWSRPEGHSEDQVDQKLDASQALSDAPTAAKTIKGSEEKMDSRTELDSCDAPSKDISAQMNTTMYYDHGSDVQSRDPVDSPQSSTSALEEALLGDASFDPILRRQLFTPLSSQQRTLKSEQSVISEKNQKVEPGLPTPRLTQSTSAPLLPPTTPERHEKSSLVERIKAMKTLSAKKAHARNSIDYSKAASSWFTRRKPSQLTHVSDSEDERESGRSSGPASMIDEELPATKPPLEPSGSNNFTDETPQTENMISSGIPPIQGLRTSFAYYAPLSTLHFQFGTLTSVLAILHSVDPIAQSKSGRHDFYRSLILSDPSSMYFPPTIARIFRPKQLALPIVSPGDAILLRNFKVQSFEKRLGLSSTDSSAWAVFRKGVEVQVRGPPVEFGPEERGFIKGLWKWWESVGAASVENAIAEAAKKAEKARSGEREYEDEVDQRSKEKTGAGKARTPRSAKGKVSGRTRSQVDSDMTPTPDSRRHQLRDGTSYPDSTPDSGRHQLRDGTSYPDSTPEKGARGVRSRSGAGVHELRDGTTYTDTDTDADGDTDGEDKLGERLKTKKGASAKPRPAVAAATEKGNDGRRARRGVEKEKGEHELRDGTRYSDDLK